MTSADLVRKNRHARPILDAFSDAGIPFELVGDLSTESIGVETVVAYLRALATPSNDVSVRRVLLMRYRLSEPDLRTPAESADRLVDAVLSVDPSAVDDPDRLKAAREDFEHLFARRTRLSIEHLYNELLNTTNIEWYLTHTDLLLRSEPAAPRWQKLDQKPASLPLVGSWPARSLRSLAVSSSSVLTKNGRNC